MFQPDQDEVYASVTISPSRRFILQFMLLALAGLLIAAAYSSTSGLFGRAMLLLAGLALLAYFEWCRRNLGATIVLTDAGLLQSDGTMIAPTEQFVKVERGALAMKPSNGFSIVLKDKQPRAWKPGLWWRLGRRVGVGGIASAGAAKFMAEQIALRLMNDKAGFKPPR